MKIEYKNGNVYELEYNDEKHTYVVEGNKIPSVTRVIDSCFPKYLTDWAVKEGADFFKQSLEPYRLAPTEDIGTFMLPAKVVDHIYKGIQTANKTISWEAADVGSAVHDWISDGIKWKLGEGEMPEMPKDEGAINCINAFKKWARNVKPEWLMTEEKIYYHDGNNIHNFAGTVDAVAKIGGKVCVIDFKTSKKIYKPYYLQVVAYQYALREMYGWPRDAKGIILRLDKETGEYQEKRFDPTGYIDTFFHCLDIKRWSSKRIPSTKWEFSEELKGPDT